AGTQQARASLEVPPDLTAPSRDERYVVPDTGARGSATYSAYNAERGAAAQAQPAAGNAQVLPSVEKMHVERAGSQRWLVVPGTPDKLWPAVKEFWQENGFILNIDRPEIGVIETDWAENRAKIPQDFIRNTLGKVIDGLYSTPERDKFRTRMELGSEPGTVEIYISHRGMVEIYPTEAKDHTIWQARPADPELEAEMLRRLMVRLGVDEAQAKTLAAVPPAAERAKVAQDKNGVASLIVDESFDRAWRRVGLALDRVGFTVEDRDRSQGVYFVRYVDPDADSKKKDEGGFLSSLAFWRSKPVVAASGSQYRVQVKNGGENSMVQVLNREGGLDQSDVARKILKLLSEQLK
ncbi:MAG: outer membrane protein assembly factor BamC, partial [Zoogloea sp.]|nr:outer membrane protein assembly factor BamC [Zoogloea sp.]